MIISIQPDGVLKFIYNDELRPLMELGRTEIKRASHVEPTPDGKWTADMSPSGGSILGPFELRQTALNEETKWLEKHLLSHKTSTK